MIIVFLYSHAKFTAYKSLLVRGCDSLHANMLRIYRDWIPLHLLRERSNITSLNDVVGNGDISDVDRGWDHSYIFSDHFPRQVRDVAAGNGHSLLWPKATTFLSHIGAYSRSETATIACGRRTQGLIRTQVWMIIVPVLCRGRRRHRLPLKSLFDHQSRW